jgi:hypothetical protein
MWTCTEHGYFSTVADREDTKNGPVWVRARSADDLVRVRDAGYDTGPIIGMVKADYPYRVKMARAEWARYLTDYVTTDLDYTNFKDRVHAVDHKRADIYMGVWHELTRIENPDWQRLSVAEVNAREAARA